MFRVNKDLCVFSPTGMHIAWALQQELTVKDIKTLKHTQLYAFTDTIEVKSFCRLFFIYKTNS